MKSNQNEQVFNYSTIGYADLHIDILYAGMGSNCLGGSHDHCGLYHRADQRGSVVNKSDASCMEHSHNGNLIINHHS